MNLTIALQKVNDFLMQPIELQICVVIQAF